MNREQPAAAESHAGRRREDENTIHPAWRELMSLCARLGYGEIERLKIHDGLPVMAELTRQKVKLG